MTTASTAQDTLARTLWGEARGQGRAGMIAVAAVVMNRANNPRWWGKDVISVCRAPSQFSCWLPRAKGGELESMLAIPAADQTWQQAQDVAKQVLSGDYVDPTNRADSYVNLAVARPSWAVNRPSCAVIGAHTFFRLELAAK